MRELDRFVESPRECSYLPRETASLEIRVIPEIGAAEYADLLARGYRRFGWQVFRPACRACVQCRSLRVPVQRFTPRAGERRILRKNETVRAELCPLFVTPEHIELYNTYHRFMHGHSDWPFHEATLRSYASNFLSGARSIGRQWLYFERDRLMGVALMDEVPGAVSLVYCFYHPDWRARSPGTFSVLHQLLYAKARNLEYAYLGYSVEQCPSLSYKARFQPHEILREYPPEQVPPVWE